MLKSVRKSAIAIAALGAVVLVGLGTSTAAGHGTFHGWADSHRIKDQSVRSVDVAPDAIGGSELRSGSVHQNHLSSAVVGKLSQPVPQGSAFSDEDMVNELGDDVRTSVGTLQGSGTRVVVASVTVSATTGPANMLCYLVDDAGNDIAVGNSNDSRESFGLTALATGPVNLECKVDGGGTATDVSITGVEVKEPAATP